MKTWNQYQNEQAAIQSRADKLRRAERIEEYAPPPGELDWWEHELRERLTIIVDNRRKQRGRHV